MKKTIFLLMTSVFTFQILHSQTIKLMTYNIRLDNRNDAENSWNNRRNFLINQIKFHEPDVFGVQEALHNQMEYLKEQLTDFEYIGVARDNGESEGEYSAIFYNSKKYVLLNHSTFWLSQTPEKPSIGWDAVYKRICTYGYFQQKESGKKIWIFNTHFDHIGEKARKNSAELILTRINELVKSDEAAILMGDLNMEATNEGITLINNQLKDSYIISEIRFGEDGTFNDFKYNKKANQRIDYIFVSENLEVKKYAILNNSYQLKFPSDHFPVFTEVKFK